MNPDEPQNLTSATDVFHPTLPAEESTVSVPPAQETAAPVEQPAEPLPMNMDFVAPPPETPAPVEQPIQMPPYAPAQPPMSERVMPTSQTEPTVPASHHKTDVLGILSIVSILFGVLPVGLILGLVGVSHAKKSHSSPVLSRVGWIINLVAMLVAVPIIFLWLSNNLQKTQAIERDTERAHDMAAIETKLESFFETNFGYPNNLDDIKVADKQNLKGPNGTSIKINDIVADEASAKTTSNPTTTQEYTYTPYGKPTCLTTCDGYVLKGYLEKPKAGATNPLVKLGIENL